MTHCIRPHTRHGEQSTRPARARAQGRAAHPKQAARGRQDTQRITLCIGRQRATYMSLVSHIRTMDELMRSYGCDLPQRGYIHHGAVLDMLRDCQTPDDERLVRDAWQTVTQEGTVPSATEARQFLMEHPGHISPRLDHLAMAAEAEALTYQGGAA